MDASIAILGGDEQFELRSLLDWLTREDDLRSVALDVESTIHPEEMGGGTEILTAALGSGSGAALISALSCWMVTRGRVRVRVEGPNGSVEIDANNPEEHADLVRKLGGLTGLIPPDAST